MDRKSTLILIVLIASGEFLKARAEAVDGSGADCILGHDKQILNAVTPALVNNAFDRNGKPSSALEDFLRSSPEVLVRRHIKNYEQSNDPIKSKMVACMGRVRSLIENVKTRLVDSRQADNRRRMTLNMPNVEQMQNGIFKDIQKFLGEEMKKMDAQANREFSQTYKRKEQ